MASVGFREFVREAKQQTGLSYREMARRAGVPEGRFSDFMARPAYNLSPVDETKIRRVVNEAQSKPMDGEVVRLRPAGAADEAALASSLDLPEDIAADLMEEVRDARRERTEIQDALAELRVGHDALALRVEALEDQGRQQQA